MALLTPVEGNYPCGGPTVHNPQETLAALFGLLEDDACDGHVDLIYRALTSDERFAAHISAAKKILPRTMYATDQIIEAAKMLTQQRRRAIAKRCMVGLDFEDADFQYTDRVSELAARAFFPTNP